VAEQQKAERGVPAWGWLLAYLGAVWLQLTASSLFPAQSPVPDVLLACSLVVGFLRGPSAGALGGTALGLTMDLIVGRLIGLSALTLGLEPWPG
jgi:cell shape-determining protein MreD